MAGALSILLGRGARQHIAEHGWAGADISLLLGASGGPKWLILGQLDRLLFGDFLLRGRSTALHAVGSSIGAWRHACLAQPDPVAAIERFEDIYTRWTYSERPDTREISDASLTMLRHILEDGGEQALLDHPRLHSYVITARGRGLNSANAPSLLAVGMGLAAAANTLHRRLLASQFQRVVFTSRAAPSLELQDFAGQQVEMREDTVAAALHACGSIPFVLAGERNIPGAPPGHYWDGGIIDYHHDLTAYAEQPLILYPHFRSDLTPGWFDKFLPWRSRRPAALANLVLLAPSAAFVASLPGGKIPDRSDFRRMRPAERQRYWRSCIDRSRELAEDFAEQIARGDPLAGTGLIETD